MPRRKSPQERQRSNTADVGLVVAGGPIEPPPPPHPPKGKLLTATVRAWDAFWTSDLAALVLDADRPALDRLFGMYDLRERMHRALLEQPFTEGSTGQTVVHPAAKELASLDGRIVALEDRFGITPMGRLKLGVVLGAAARSLDEMNRSWSDDDEAEPDPRLRAVVDASASDA